MMQQEVIIANRTPSVLHSADEGTKEETGQKAKQLQNQIGKLGMGVALAQSLHSPASHIADF
jgi:hypothetical protein